MRLGLFDPDEINPYAELDPVKVVQSAEHRQLALDSAQRSFVLLKNDKKFLPFKANFKFSKIAVRLHHKHYYYYYYYFILFMPLVFIGVRDVYKN